MLKLLQICFKLFIVSILINISICKDINNSNMNYNNNNNNNNVNDNLNRNDNNDSVMNNLTWDCANNATCVQNVARKLITNYENGDNIDFGLFNIEKLPVVDNLKNNNNNNKDTQGRSLSTIQQFIEGNAIKIPIGPMVFSMQRSDDYPDYMELALLKKVNEKLDEGVMKGRGRGGSGIRKRRGHKDKKHLQVFIPLYLAANTFGWTLLAVKAVGVLTIKALLVSKLAFLIAAGIVAKKVMDSAQQKMLFPHHPHPYLMPYSMDYGLPAHSMPGAEEYLNMHLANHQALETMAAAETNHVVHAIHANATQQQLLNVPGLNGNPNSPKIKRSDQWSGVQPSRSSSPFYNYFGKSSASSPYAYQK